MTIQSIPKSIIFPLIGETKDPLIPTSSEQKNKTTEVASKILHNKDGIMLPFQHIPTTPSPKQQPLSITQHTPTPPLAADKKPIPTLILRIPQEIRPSLVLKFPDSIGPIRMPPSPFLTPYPQPIKVDPTKPHFIPSRRRLFC